MHHDYRELIDNMGEDVRNYQEYKYVQSAKEILQIDCQPMNSNLVHFLDRLVQRYWQTQK